MRNLLRAGAQMLAIISSLALGGCTFDQVMGNIQAGFDTAVTDIGIGTTAVNNANLAAANAACTYLEAGVGAWNQYVSANPTGMSDADDEEGNLYAAAVDSGCAGAPFTSLTQEAIGVYQGYQAFYALAQKYGIKMNAL